MNYNLPILIDTDAVGAQVKNIFTHMLNFPKCHKETFQTLYIAFYEFLGQFHGLDDSILQMS